MKTDEDRCKEYGVPYDPSITRAKVYQQSGWKCHLCGKRVRKSLKYPHPRSASLDHIVPLSWRKNSPGHVWGNVALAHLRCNQSKGARFAGSTRPAPKRPGIVTPIWKLRLLLFVTTALLFYFGATATVLTIASVLCILTVVPQRKVRRRRRRAWWKL
ncbi:HNH endonuclease [Streptomyces phage Yaboi]|uniref:HNH endonuclease n=2 Tax=Streptomyces virus Yaboi TaxID=2846408 RepID=A0A385UH67_9CAUD|nr:HNH endonuclease [Streptomyces phage Yaboi]AYB70878.1 HNH endonuclease [Streptomyces phage Yaboi]QAY12691.1 HNH endonuclease [Streptomyces phage BoomerJR]UVD39887.1 HNH endonuclease [Streptomyces phage Stanimal]WNM73628.1 HNH endonuclease [Streptomyces phage Sollertia]